MAVLIDSYSESNYNFNWNVAGTKNPADNTKLLNIGNFGLNGATETGRYFNGKMDDISIFDVDMSAAQVLALYTVQVKKFMGGANT